MRQVFEIESFPDLSLPRYFDLFGEEALTVAATRLFNWLQLVASAGQEFSFTLRYFYDPDRAPSNRRLRIFVLISTPGNDVPEALLLGARLASEVLPLREAAPSEAAPPVEWTASLAMLERNSWVFPLDDDHFYIPAAWTRQPSARQALEPYLDEAFAALGSPAFLDIQLHACDPDAAREAIQGALDVLETRRQLGKSAGEEVAGLYREMSDSLGTDPVCRLLLCAGAPDAASAESLLRAFGVDAIGGARFRVRAAPGGGKLHSALRAAVECGEFNFATATGWYSPVLETTIASAENGTYSEAQVDLLRCLSELSVLAGPTLVADVLTLPVPRRGFLRTFPLETETERRSESVELPSIPGSIRLGQGLERQSPIDLPVADLTRHAFIAGVTGSGKTVTVFNILKQLAEQSIPFLVFEPGKAEYRAFIGYSAVAKNLRIYTPGRDDLAPLRLNPFVFEPHITLTNHIANLAASFNCALGLIDPVSRILEEALWDLYEAGGWREDDWGQTRPGVPRVDEIPEAVCRIIDRMGYDPEINARFKGVIRGRFIRFSRGSVGRLFDCTNSSPTVSELCSGNTVIELRALSPQEANLVTLFLLQIIRQHLADRRSETSPRLIMVLEEAHNLVPAVSDQAESDESNARAEASRYVSNMLAEMRALGLGILVVDQTPAAVAPQVVRNTNLKIAHRTVAREDRETLADAMLMHPAHAELLGRLSAGQAYVYAESFFRPHLMKGAFVRCDANVAGPPASASPPTDSELAVWLLENRWFKEALKVRADETRMRCQNIDERVGVILSRLDDDIQRLSSYSGTEGLERVRDEIVADYRARLQPIVRQIASLEAECRAVLRMAGRGRNAPKPPSADQLARLREKTAILDNAMKRVEATRVVPVQRSES
ncbi:MAG: DUF87 domain-containing protein [Bryobacteraceae bacterium]